MRGVAILGATGSIGLSALDVIKNNSNEFFVTGLSAGSNAEVLAKSIKEFRPKKVSLATNEAAEKLKNLISLDGIELFIGEDASKNIATDERADIVISAIVGAAGLEPTMAAAKLGKRIALANKESLVMGGQLLLDMVAHSDAEILPVDSEHSAIFQANLAGDAKEVRRIILTASGGPFRTRESNFESITREEALNHPTWDMGAKISIDSATLMNKALEVIEARWLFDIPVDRIEVWIHPQSVIHSMVEFVDGSIIAQLGATDMRMPIHYALTYPERKPGGVEYMRLEDMMSLTFERPRTDVFKGLELGFRAAREGGTMGAVLNAANEVTVDAFLSGSCGFMDIPRINEAVMDEHKLISQPTLQELWEMDNWARLKARELVEASK